MFVNTDLDACIARDPKGLYAKALKGEIANFTGVSSPYERPDDAEIVLDTAGVPADELASRVVAELVRRGVV